MFTLRRGLENSVNVVTAHLLDGGISVDPEKSLDEVCATAVAAKIYSKCIRYYPFVLGAQPVRMIDLAAFYAAVANEGALPQPHAIESIETDGHTVYQYPNTPLPFIGAADRNCLLSAQDDVAGRRGARHRAGDRCAVALRRRQDRDYRRCGRRMVHRIYQRRDHCLQGIAEPNSVIIAESTRKLLGNLFDLEDLGAKDLKGIAGPVPAWAALRPSSAEGRFEALHTSGLTELVGRDEEIELLLRRWAKAKTGEGQVVLLSGEAGIGKSRLTPLRPISR